MCGILFVLGELPLSTVVACLGTIEGRGGDGTSAFSHSGVSGGFTRLAIQGTTGQFMQPLMHGAKMLLYNGELYNAAFQGSDGPLLLKCIAEHGVKALRRVHGEFAGVVHDFSTGVTIVFRDPTGVRPLFYGKNASGVMCFASEAKALLRLCTRVRQFLPNTAWVLRHQRVLQSHVIVSGLYASIPDERASVWERLRGSVRVAGALRRAVRMRCVADRPVGCFVSGGMDSSLVAALVVQERAALGLPAPSLYTVCVGDASTDLPYARAVAAALCLPITVINFSVEEAWDALPGVVDSLESACVTTVRASTPQWLACQWIRMNTNTRVLFSGEGADELGGGYQYFHGAPSPRAADEDCVRLLQNLHLYDNLRVDRCAGAHGLEARIPFLDHSVIKTYRENTALEERAVCRGMEKRALRRAASLLVPEEMVPIMWRRKEALSDGAGYGWVDHLRARFGTLENEHIYYKNLLGELAAYELVPLCWMPRWNAASDPSARFLHSTKHADAGVQLPVAPGRQV